MRRRSFVISTLSALIAPRFAAARPAAALDPLAAGVPQAGSPAAPTAGSVPAGIERQADSRPVIPSIPGPVGASATGPVHRLGHSSPAARLPAESGVGAGRSPEPGPQPAPTLTRAPILLHVSPLAGFQYHRGPRLWPRLQAGQPLHLVREPDNSYDPRAVRIDWNGEKLGYLPRMDNAAASQLLDRGERLTARIAGLAEDPDPWRRVTVAVVLISASNGAAV